MKYKLNNIGWMGIIICLLIAMCTSSCKKDNDTKPLKSITVNNTVIVTEYARETSVARSCSETDIIKIYDRNGVKTMSCPMMQGDRVDSIPYPSFNIKFPSLPIKLSGSVTIQGTKLYLTYIQTTTYSSPTRTVTCPVYSVVYNKVP